MELKPTASTIYETFSAVENHNLKLNFRNYSPFEHVLMLFLSGCFSSIKFNYSNAKAMRAFM